MNVASSSKRILSSIQLSTQTRSVSSSPYGRTHVWRRRHPKLPSPIVPQFPQRVILADGSSFTHWTTSPRSTIKLTRDTTNNPLWNPWLEAGNAEDLEGSAAGRLGRFRRKFEDLGGLDMQVEWFEEQGSGSKKYVEPRRYTMTLMFSLQEVKKVEQLCSHCFLCLLYLHLLIN